MEAVHPPHPRTPYPPLIVNAAITGMVASREQVPSLPVTAEQIARDARVACHLGAGVIHLHARDADGRPDWRPEVIRGDHLGGAGRMPRRRAVREHERSRAFRARPPCGRAEPRRRCEARHGQPHSRLARLRHRAQRERARDGRGAGGADARRRDPARARGIRLRDGERGAAPAAPRAHPRAALREPDARRPPHRARDDARAVAPRRLPAARHRLGCGRHRRLPAQGERARRLRGRAHPHRTRGLQRACRPATRR